MTFQAVPPSFALGSLNELAINEAERKLPDLGLIPYGHVAPELAMRPNNWTPELHPADAIAQLKVDGISAIHIEGRFYSMQGTPLDCCNHALRAIQKLERIIGCSLVVACEYENGTFRDTLSAMRSGVAGNGTCWVYDAVPFEQWKGDRCQRPLRERLAQLEAAFAYVPTPSLGLLASFPVATAGEVVARMEECRFQKLEGLVIKAAGSTFVRSRSNDWLRAKVKVTEDGHVVGLQGDRAIVNVPGHGTVKVSGCLGDLDPDEVDPMNFIGKWVEVDFHIEAGTENMRQVRFVRWREDKDFQNG